MVYYAAAAPSKEDETNKMKLTDNAGKEKSSQRCKYYIPCDSIYEQFKASQS